MADQEVARLAKVLEKFNAIVSPSRVCRPSRMMIWHYATWIILRTLAPRVRYV
jgi:hypothetical protein